MPLLRITQTREAERSYQVEISLEKDGQRVQTGRARFDFELSRDEQEDLRWYFEDYLVFSGIEPAPTIAARIEGQLQQIGRRLFEDVFHANNVTRGIWAKIAEELSDSRVEIAVDVSEGTDVPWELLFDPDTGEYVALEAGTFVRTHCGAVRAVRVPEVAESLRILLVICRPAKDKLPFRSDAMCILKGLGASERATFRLDVLRPPRFDEMARALRRAKAEGQAYHIVHFDGHGTFMDVVESDVDANLLLSTPARSGAHGYLVFENPEIEDDVQYVDGPALGRVLVESDVSVLVLNACRSAYAKPGTEPSRVGQDPHATVRAFGSLAQEVMDQGVPGVVAMRYTVYVMTGAQFLVDMYGELARAGRLGEAVTSGRKQLRAKPSREIAYSPCRLDDWSVPVVYEGAPIALLSRPVKDAPLEIKLRGVGEAAAGEAKGLDADLPKTPDVGFFGRDETLLALDRAFDGQSVILLHAYAGSGKTATSAEFARWYLETGGLDGGAVLFSKFEQYTPLRAVLAHFGAVFGAVLERAGTNWGALTETSDMRDVALQVLRQVPVLWIWDNVEPVAGFPKGTESAWSPEEQEELVDFLRDARQTKAKFLLTSRRDEQDWLRDLPRRIRIPAMPMAERVQLARALAAKYGRRLAEVEDWRPLLEFTQGNPQTITAVVGQALRDGLKSREEIEAYVAELRRGEGKFADEESEGRSKSLGASLNYGFEHAFDEDERRQLALLHLFQGFVDVDAVKLMGEAQADWCLAEVRGLAREVGMVLLDRAGEVGLLTAYGGGYYGIHPALPWFFKGLFDRYYAGRALEATRAFVEAMGELGSYYNSEYENGKREVIRALRAEETNLLHARRLARANGWWRRVISTMQGLRRAGAENGKDWWRRLCRTSWILQLMGRWPAVRKSGV
ncbi:MAG: CHAT domain-containing protein [Planctomycetota bacterium]